MRAGQGRNANKGQRDKLGAIMVNGTNQNVSVRVGDQVALVWMTLGLLWQQSQ